MCIGSDHKIAEMIGGDVDGKTILNTATPILGPALNRRALLFVNTSGNQVTLSNSPNVSVGNGLVLTNVQTPIILREEEWGALLNKPWYAIASVGNATLSWLESVWGT